MPEIIDYDFRCVLAGCCGCTPCSSSSSSSSSESLSLGEPTNSSTVAGGEA